MMRDIPPPLGQEDVILLKPPPLCLVRFLKGVTEFGMEGFDERLAHRNI
jgi:hypothetical protein